MNKILCWLFHHDWDYITYTWKGPFGVIVWNRLTICKRCGKDHDKYAGFDLD